MVRAVQEPVGRTVMDCIATEDGSIGVGHIIPLGEAHT